MNIELLKTLKVLYVEDEIILRDTTCSSLSSILKEIVVANNGKEGLEKFNDSFDLVISDLSMPVMNGNEMIKEIRKIDQNIPIIITTAYGSQNEDVAEISNISKTDYVMKPIDIMKLVKTIDKVVSK